MICRGQIFLSKTQQTKGEKEKSSPFPLNVAPSSSVLRQLFSGLKAGRQRKKHRSFVKGLYTATGLPDASPKNSPHPSAYTRSHFWMIKKCQKEIEVTLNGNSDIKSILNPFQTPVKPLHSQYIITGQYRLIKLFQTNYLRKRVSTWHCFQLPAKIGVQIFLLCTVRGTTLRRPQGGPREQSQHQAGWGCHHTCRVDTSVPCDITQSLNMHDFKSRSKNRWL